MSEAENWIDMVGYDEHRVPDEQYKELLTRILEEGTGARSGMDEGSRQILGHVMRFEMSNGFPLITERDLLESMSTPPEEYNSNTDQRRFAMSARQGLGEILGFINGARTIQELENYGNKWWKFWATDAKCSKRGLESGDLGPGSYGAAFHDFPDPDGGTFNQFDAILRQVEHRPELRTHIISPYIPPYTIRVPERKQGVVVVPCHGNLRFDIDTEANEFSLVHMQRSADVPVGLPFNMIHYATVMAMFSRHTGYTPKELVYFIDNAHIYSRHFDQVEEILSRPAKPFPKLKINGDVIDFFDFRVDDFQIEGYDAHPPINMGGTPV